MMILLHNLGTRTMTNAELLKKMSNVDLAITLADISRSELDYNGFEAAYQYWSEWLNIEVEPETFNGKYYPNISESDFKEVD